MTDLKRCFAASVHTWMGCLLVTALLSGCASSQRPTDDPGLYFLGRATWGCEKDLSQFLASYGIQARGFSGNLGRVDILLEGTEADLFHARRLVKTHAAERKWDFLWMADITLHPGENEEDDLVLEMMADGTLPPWIRIATVEFEKLPSQRVLALLRAAEFECHVSLGKVRDDLYVPREDADRAIQVLSSQTLPGLEIRWPPPE